MKFLSLSILLLLAQPAQSSPDETLLLPAIFADGMVLQQQTDVRFWGKAAPGADIVIRGSWGASATALVTKDGSWMAKLRTPAAGGPFDVAVRSGTVRRMFSNVMVGEVWLCSGQSNMELALEGSMPFSPIRNSVQEIKHAQYPRMRVFTVGRNLSVRPEFSCSGEWKPCDSTTAARFSATAYFFGRSLYEKLRVPIGLIVSSWGGTPIEAWTSESSLRDVGSSDSMLARLDSNRETILRQVEWVHRHPTIDVSAREPRNRWRDLEFGDRQCPMPGYDDSRWDVMNLPTLWERTNLGEFDGAVWFRKKVEIPESWIHRDLLLELGPIDDVDRAYVNATLVGATEDEELWRQDRIYTIPKESVCDSILTLAVRVIDYGGGGGMYGDKAKMRIRLQDDTSWIALAGAWRYLPVAEFAYMKFYTYGADGEPFFSRPPASLMVSPATPGVLFNGMISPLLPFGIKGVIWYQGESNTHEPLLYRKLLPAMIQNWRTVWHNRDLPFYYVQIAPFDYGPAVNSQLLRESQLLTLSVAHTGMVVTMDIGDSSNIHPANKKDVGERLARWTFAREYRKPVPCSGPLYKSMKIAGDRIILSFDYPGRRLVLQGNNAEANFLIAGDERRFVRAEVRVLGKQLIVSSPEVENPVAVRYAWSNIAKATLFNADGLPASSFRTDDWGE